ncbi:GNAT family N-acetyltransferase [Actinosynnema sp. NPDC020468]|uniref:GNAT family N-acetyltransferase n=1 Tax=Actinosynnema sp. NPDC020468 TaxID=3154488 RepID=UPI0033D93C56
MSDPRIRRVREDDVPAVVGLVVELAEYEKARHECLLTERQLHDALFAPEPALFGHVAEVDGEVVGIALWFLSFSTWRGTHGLYLEDLYVSPARRGTGLGKALLVTLAQLSVERGYARLEWTVLDWNASAIGFYRSIGAVPMDEWTVQRVTDDALVALARQGA